MREKARSSLPPSSPSTPWVSLAKPVASWVPVSFSRLGTAYQKEKMLYPVCTFSSYSLREPREVGQDRSPFPPRHQARVQVPLTPQLCRVPDGLSQLTPDTAHPIRVRPAQLHWPESRGIRRKSLGPVGRCVIELPTGDTYVGDHPLTIGRFGEGSDFNLRVVISRLSLNVTELTL